MVILSFEPLLRWICWNWGRYSIFWSLSQRQGERQLFGCSEGPTKSLNYWKFICPPPVISYRNYKIYKSNLIKLCYSVVWRDARYRLGSGLEISSWYQIKWGNVLPLWVTNFYFHCCRRSTSLGNCSLGLGSGSYGMSSVGNLRSTLFKIIIKIYDSIPSVQILWNALCRPGLYKIVQIHVPEYQIKLTKREVRGEILERRVGDGTPTKWWLQLCAHWRLMRAYLKITCILVND